MQRAQLGMVRYADAADARKRLREGTDDEVDVLQHPLVLGAAAPVPWRASAVEKALVGKKLDEASARAAALFATEGATPLDKNRHKLPALQAAVLQSLLLAGGLA